MWKSDIIIGMLSYLWWLKKAIGSYSAPPEPPVPNLFENLEWGVKKMLPTSHTTKSFVPHPPHTKSCIHPYIIDILGFRIVKQV